jgi:hypothetical protein
MTTQRSLFVVAALLFTAPLLACGGTDRPPGTVDAGTLDGGNLDLGEVDAAAPFDGAPVDADTTPDATVSDGGPATTVTIYDVQDESRATFVPAGTLVHLEGVRITAIDTLMEAGLGGVGDLWIQESAAGLFSGVQIYQPTTVVPCGAALTLARGDVVTVDALTTEFAVPSDVSGDTVTELIGALVTCTTPAATAGALPVPLAITDPTVLAAAATAEGYEGVPVVLTGVDALELADLFGSFAVSGEVLVDDALYAHPVSRRDRFLQLTGVVHYVFDRVRIFPRDAADLVLGPPRPLEDLAGAWACTDGTDSDSDALVDCADPDCSRSAFCVGSPVRVRVQDVQDASSAAHPAEGARVVLAGPLVVTAVDGFAEAGGSGTVGNVYVQDVAAASAAYSGVVVFLPTTLGCGAAPLAVGDQVYVAGRYEEYAGDPPDVTVGTLTEIVAGTIVCVSAGAVPAPILIADSATLAGDTPREAGTGEPYEGVLVEVRGRDVIAAPGPFGEWRVDGELRVDDDLYAATPAPASGERLGRLIGVIDSANGRFQLQPRSAADVVRVPRETTLALCTNGTDDDVDGVADCADLDCCVVPSCSGSLVLSEIAYDVTGTDGGKEWIEVLNNGTSAAQLGCFTIGSGAATYSAVTPALPTRSVAVGECLVIGGPTACGGATCTVPADFTPDLPNSSSSGVPGVGLFRGATITATSVPTDAVVYGIGTPLLLSPAGTVFAAPSVGAAAADRSIERFGAASAATWRVQNIPTPGTCTAITP